MDSMMAKLIVLERMEQLLLKGENPEKNTNPKGKKRKSLEPGNPNFHLVESPQDESSIREKPIQPKGTVIEPTPEEMPRSSRLAKIESVCKIETLTRRVEMPTFEGWNPKGWIFRMERFFVAHRMSKEEKITAVTISLDGEALAWFQWEESRRPI